MTLTQSRADMSTYRAAYWISADGQSSVVLTLPERGVGSPDADLLAAADIEIAAVGLIREDGDEVRIGNWTA